MSTISIKGFTITSFLFLLLVLTKGAFAEQVTGNSFSPDEANENMIPPPPPGPYVSTGLLEAAEERPTTPDSPSYEVINPSATSDAVDSVVSAPVVAKPAMTAPMPPAAPRVEPNTVPMSTFSPDRPWPNNMRPMDVPAQAYQQAAPSRMQAPTFNNVPPTYNQGYNRSTGSYMNVPATQWAPPINAGPQGANGYMPIAPASQYGYQMPGNFVPKNNMPPNNMNYGYPMNRMPYPPTNYQQQGYPN